jgi:hypothetical protein
MIAMDNLNALYGSRGRTAEVDGSYQIYDGKVVLRITHKTCQTSAELLASDLFLRVLNNFTTDLHRKKSRLMHIFAQQPPSEADYALLVQTFQFLVKLPADLVPRVLEGCDPFLKDRTLLYEYVEQLYNYWRALHRVIICDSSGDRLDHRPYRTFNETVETLMHVVRSTYRDIQENISGNHPRVYRQVSAGAEVAAIALPAGFHFPAVVYSQLNNISVIRQILIYPPMIFNTPMNKRKGSFERVAANPLDGMLLNPAEWLCYPAKVGPLVIMIYFSMRFFELGFSLCNLFELADNEDLQRQPDAIYLFGSPELPASLQRHSDTVFYDDEANHLLVGVVPCRDEFGYFGYLKKMVLTLHNIQMMKQGRLPYHGAMFHIALRDQGHANVLVIGDTGAGKSETLEALRLIARDDVEDLTIIADDMGSLEVDPHGRLLGYGTETGAFVRLDDLASGYAFGQMDRTIIMNADQVNARVVVPVTTFAEVVRGYPVDYILYANNYDEVDDEHPVIERFATSEDALEVFRAGAVMSKGTTTSSGLVHSYFANIFGAPQYRQLHDPLAVKYFEEAFRQGVFVGQLRTRLGVDGMEQQGPKESAKALLEILGKRAKQDHTSD